MPREGAWLIPATQGVVLTSSHGRARVLPVTTFLPVPVSSGRAARVSTLTQAPARSHVSGVLLSDPAARMTPMFPLVSLPSPAVDLQVTFWGSLWGVALVVWGVCATLVAVSALLRSSSTGEAGQLERLHGLILRSRLVGSSPVASGALAAPEQAPIRSLRRWWLGRRQRQPAPLAVKQAVA